jgi:hypothetical protein
MGFSFQKVRAAAQVGLQNVFRSSGQQLGEQLGEGGVTQSDPFFQD